MGSLCLDRRDFQLLNVCKLVVGRTHVSTLTAKVQDSAAQYLKNKIENGKFTYNHQPKQRQLARRRKGPF
jgi:hypothetical protein